MNRVLVAASLVLACLGSAVAQDVNTTPSKKVLDEAAGPSCEGVSLVVQRCAPKAEGTAKKPVDDASSRSRAATKAAFDRRDKRASDAALKGESVPANTPTGDAQRLGGVTVTGKGDDKGPSVEEVLQRALNPNSEGVLSPDGKTITRYAPDGTSYDCVAKCVGPMCCITRRTLPNPAHDSNSIGR
jgi:hypothetical protein